MSRTLLEEARFAYNQISPDENTSYYKFKYIADCLNFILGYLESIQSGTSQPMTESQDQDMSSSDDRHEDVLRCGRILLVAWEGSNVQQAKELTLPNILVDALMGGKSDAVRYSVVLGNTPLTLYRLPALPYASLGTSQD